MRKIYALLVLAFFFTANNAFAQKEKPNFLFIAIDDLNTSIGASRDMDGNFMKSIYPDKQLRDEVAKRLTPHLDRLASEGRQFVNAMCQSPLCGPSRTSLLAGVPAHVSGYYTHEENFRTYETLKDVTTLPQLLQANGYYTAGLGKIYHKPDVVSLTAEGDWPDAKYSWTKWISSGGGVNLGDAELPEMSPKSDRLMRFGPSSLATEETRDWQNSHFTACLLENGKATIDDNFTKKDETIELPANKPFFLASGIFRPHLPFYAPKEYFDLFPTSEMKIDKELLEKVAKDIEDLPEAGKKWTQLTKGKFYEVISQGERIAGEQGKIEAWKQCVQAYLACVAYADACVGEILRGLDNSPYKNNTIVILWSDHGYFLGDKARIAKQCLWRESLNCNLIVKMPDNQKERGVPSRQVVSLSDLYPTILAMANFDRPAGILGENIIQLVQDPKTELPRKYFYSTY